MTTSNLAPDFTYDERGPTATTTAITFRVSGEPRRTANYRGEQFDPDLGLYYLRARYYNPATGRFLSEDPAEDGVNLYSYADESPTNFIDPLGLVVSAPGFAESLIPVWGSGRQAIHDYQCGHWVWGTVNAGLAITDVFLVKSLATAAGKVGVEGLAKVAGSHTWDATRKWMTNVGWRDYAGQSFHHWAIPQRGWGTAIPDIVKNQPWNIMRMSPEEHTALHQMEGAGRIWNGMPNWAKVAAGDALGKTANLAGRSCGCE